DRIGVRNQPRLRRGAGKSRRRQGSGNRRNRQRRNARNRGPGRTVRLQGLRVSAVGETGKYRGLPLRLRHTLGPFSRQSKAVQRTGPSPAEMRGRAAEIADPSGLDWEVVWEALKTEPPADSPSTITQELGLGEEQELTQTTSDMPATEFSGTRN